MVHMQITPSEDPIISATVDSISNVAHGPQHGISRPDLCSLLPAAVWRHFQIAFFKMLPARSIHCSAHGVAQPQRTIT
jgi:hypothetical protein